MQLFKDWWPTQGPEIWGTLDLATQEHLKQHFAVREICDDQLMALYWTRDVHEYADHYAAMARIQLGNLTMQPHINKYGEYQQITKGSGSSTGTVTNTTSKGTRVTDSRNRTENWTEDMSQDEAGTVNGTTSRSSSENSRDVKSVNTQVGTSGSETKLPYTVTENGGGSSETTYSDEKEVLSFDRRAKENTKNGSMKVHLEAEAAKNYEKDAPGAKESVTHKVKTQTTTKQLGEKVITEDSRAATTAKQASKAAPMSAVGIQRLDDPGEGSFHSVRNGSITSLDFEFASQYGENAGESGTTAERREKYEGDENIVSSQGNEIENVDTTKLERNLQRAKDETTTTSYENYKDRTEDSGTETRTKSGGHKVSDSKNGTTSYGTQESSSSTTETHTGSETTDGDKRGQVSGTDTTTDSRLSHKSGTDTGIIADNDTRQEDVEGKAERTSSSSEQEQKTTTNRYTGREGLTPHEAMAGALEYLKSYPPCIVWLCDKLEHNFIRVYDI